MRLRDDLVFSMDEYQRRLADIRAGMESRRLDAFICTTPENIFYLTGYQTTGYFCFQALVVPLEAEPFMVVRLLEESNVDARTWVGITRHYTDTEDPITVMRFALREMKLHQGRIGYEKQSWFFRAHEQEQLFSSMLYCTFVDASGMVENSRLRKSDEELAVMRKASVATEAGIKAGIEAVAPGVTENDIAAEIHYAMIKAGSEYPAMSPFVASGWRGALGHTTWEGRRVQPNENVFIEVAGCYHRYHVAMMRSVFVGDPPPEILEAERLIQDAMVAALNVIHAGVSSGDVDAQSRYVLDRYSFGGTQATRSGYSIGIAFAPDWGEGHILDIKAGDHREIDKSMTFHLIPWLQMPGKFGMGLSETIIVTDNSSELFCDVPRKLFVK
ncbi:MAG TPA: M24 family metallopeptidase [bacterium]|nr:M24 family metallopeptidase [bacterium]